MRRTSKTSAYLVLLLGYVLGCGALGWFGYFLWAGPRPAVHLNLPTPAVLAFDGLLSLAFFLQHSGMIRKSFGARMASVLPVPYHPAVYAIASGAVLLLLPALWQRAPLEVYALPGPWRWLMRGAFLAALACMVWGFASLRHFDPIGVGPLLVHLRGAPAPTTPLTIRGPYRWVRHPIYFLMLVLIWASPEATADRLLFNVLWTGWMIVATRLEERDLVAEFGQPYVEYQHTVPMLVPLRLRPPRLAGGAE